MCIIVMARARKDAKALEAAIERFYPDWPIEVVSLGGVRGEEELLKAVNSVRRSGCLHIVFLGKEDWSKVEQIEKETPLDTIVYKVPREKIRNTRLEQLARMLLEALSRFSNYIYWDPTWRTYVSSPKPLRDGLLWLDQVPPKPHVDVFIALGAWKKILEKLGGVKLGANPLVVRLGEGVGKHVVYQGYKPVLEVWLESPKLEARRLSEDYEVVDVDTRRLVEASAEYMRVLVEWSKTMIRRALEEYDPDHVVVPWSGGKDSTATMLVALEVVPRNKLHIVYSDTGTEFPHTHEYIERLSKTLRIEVYRVYAGVDKELLSGREMPTHNTRWCTGLKLKALREYVSRLEGRVLMIVGDRGAESERRAGRSPVGPDKYIGGERVEVYRVAPIRVWSALHVQLYLLGKGVPLHPLYSLGFYRIGCYMCPSLRAWEVNVMESTPYIREKLLSSPETRKIYTMFLQLRASQLLTG